MTVVISPNLHKVSERLDKFGNIIDPKTKQVLKTQEPAMTPPVVPPVVTQSEQVVEMGLPEIKVKIAETEAYLRRLYALKQQKVEELKKLLEEEN